MQLRLISTPKAQSQLLILNFLKLESWTNDKNLCELLEINTKQLKIILNPLIEEKLICIDLSTPPIKWVLLSLILNGLRAEQTQYDG